MVVTLLIMAFCSIILELFLEDVSDAAKYNQQMETPTDLKVVAYSVLDLAVSFLWEYKQNQSVDKKGGGTKKKGGNKFIFDAEILGDTPNDLSISKYIVSQLSSLTSGAPFGSKFSRIVQTGDGNSFTFGDYTVQLSFEDLNAKVPFCRTFNDTTKKAAITTNPMSKGLVLEAIQKLPKKYDGVRSPLRDWINNKWKDISIRRWAAITSKAPASRAGGAVPFDVKSLGEFFIIEPYIIDAITNKNKEFKINLLTASKEILDAISDTSDIPTFSAGKITGDYDAIITRKKLGKYCSTEIQFFELKLYVSFKDDTYVVRAVYDATVQREPFQRLPFYVIKIEEI
jgi:hypothetical protein